MEPPDNKIIVDFREKKVAEGVEAMRPDQRMPPEIQRLVQAAVGAAVYLDAANTHAQAPHAGRLAAEIWEALDKVENRYE